MSGVPFSWMYGDPALIVDQLRALRARLNAEEKKTQGTGAPAQGSADSQTDQAGNGRRIEGKIKCTMIQGASSRL